MPRRAFSVALLGVALGAGVAACAPVRRVSAPRLPATLPSPAELAATLSGRRDAVHSLRALAQLRYRDAEESGSLRQAIVVARPGRLRVDVLSLLGVVWVVTARDGAITAYAPREATVYRGPATPANLLRYARVPLAVDELIDVLLATPEAEAGGTGTVTAEPESGRIRWSGGGSAGRRSVWLGDSGVPVAAERSDADGQVLWHADFAGYEPHGGVAVATRVKLELPPLSRSIDVTLRDVDLNPPLDNSLFAVQTPPGSREVILD